LDLPADAWASAAAVGSVEFSILATCKLSLSRAQPGGGAKVLP